MKRILCAVAAALVLLGSVAAYNGDVIVYVTNTGSKYHRAGCSYLKSSNEITLEAAVNQGYSPCSRCNPPRLSGEKPNAESNGPGRTDRMWEGFASNDASSGTSRTSRWLEEYNASHPDEAKAAGNAGSELDMALREKERAIEAKEWAEKKADTAQSLYDSLREDYNTLQDDYKEIKRTVFYGGLIVVFVGLPLYYIWFYYWKKRETERITASVRASLEAATLNTERLESSPKKRLCQSQNRNLSRNRTRRLNRHTVRRSLRTHSFGKRTVSSMRGRVFLKSWASRLTSDLTKTATLTRKDRAQRTHLLCTSPKAGKVTTHTVAQAGKADEPSISVMLNRGDWALVTAVTLCGICRIGCWSTSGLSVSVRYLGLMWSLKEWRNLL